MIITPEIFSGITHIRFGNNYTLSACIVNLRHTGVIAFSIVPPQVRSSSMYLSLEKTC